MELGWKWKVRWNYDGSRMEIGWKYNGSAETRWKEVALISHHSKQLCPESVRNSAPCTSLMVMILGLYYEIQLSILLSFFVVVKCQLFVTRKKVTSSRTCNQLRKERPF